MAIVTRGSRSIKAKIVKVVVGSLITISQVNLLMSSLTIRDSLIQSSHKSLLSAVNKTASAVDQVLQDRILILQSVARKSELLEHEFDSEEIRELLFEESQKLGFRDIHMANTEGVLRLAEYSVDTSQESIYINALQGKSTYSPPMQRSYYTAINLATPIYDENGEIIGVLIATQDLQSFSDIVMDGQYISFIMDNEKNYLAHSEEKIIEFEPTDITNYEENEAIKEEIIANEEGVTEWRLETDGKMYFLGYDKVETTGWTIAILEEEGGIKDNIQTLMLQNGIVMLIVVGISIFLIMSIISKQIIRHIEGITKHLSILAQGDFKTEVEQELLTQDGEIGIAAHAMNDMRQAIGKMIDTLKVSIYNMTRDGKELKVVSENLFNNSTEISNATNEIAVSIQREAVDLSDVLENVSIFGKEIEEIVQSIYVINNQITDTSDKTKKGNKDAIHLGQSVEEVNQSFDEFITTLHELTQNINKVTDITNLINGIASQTNLLALNASIEAARAGEAGKGFAVVAREIRKLADECTNSADDISSIIGEVAQEAEGIVGKSVYLGKEMQEQQGIINHTIDTYTHVTKDIEKIEDYIKQIYKSVQQLDQDKNRIIDKVESSAALGEEISAITEEVAAATKDMLGSSEKVGVASKMLGDMTEDIAQEIDKFTV